MAHPQVVVWEREPRLAPLLQKLTAVERWVLREPRQRDLFWQYLRRPTPTVCVVSSETGADDALAVAQQVHSEYPHIGLVVVGSVANAETLAGLAWDVGADYALFPPLSRDLLPDVVRGLMFRAIKLQSPPGSPSGLLASFEDDG
jgi:DNA-binding NarL/FixJ family response regulator